MHQIKKKKVMITIIIKVNVIIIEATVSDESQKFSINEMQIENVFICQSDQELDDNNTDKEYLDINYIDELNILTAVLHSDK